MPPTKLARSILVAITHPAALFSAGNVALIFGHAEPIAILLNIGLTVTISSARLVELLTSRTLGIPFSILACVNFFTAISIEFNQSLGAEGSRLFTEGLSTFSLQSTLSSLTLVDISNLASLDHIILAGHASAFALVLWGIGSLIASRHEKKGTTAHRIQENPQTYYGAGDMIAVNAGGHFNPFSFPFMALGFVKSTLIGRKKAKTTNNAMKFMQTELTAARIYGIGYIVGALTSLAFLNFAIAQALWAAAYFRFKRDV